MGRHSAYEWPASIHPADPALPAETKETNMADDRPNPLKDVASKVGLAIATLLGFVGALVQFGVWTAAQGEAVNALGNAIPPAIEAVGVIVAGLIPAVSGVWAAFHVANRGKDHVTPVSAPRDNHGNRLAPAPHQYER